ncbi:BSP-domain-containing protein [Sarocladium strictum]
MPRPPETTPNPSSVLTPAMSPVVHRPAPSASSTKEKDKDHFQLPKLRLEIRDLSHPGAPIFLSAINTTEVLQKAVRNVLHHLYVSNGSSSESASRGTPPPTRSVTLILRPMPGVAYTTSTELDTDHKEIHFSLPYISNISPTSRHAHEITGVLTHELVHCYQFNAQGTCPGGLIEGIADWVRLQCGLKPPHWKKDAKGDWDGGYQHTAYFLQYLEERFGENSVRRVNEKLRHEKYHEKPFWTELFGRPVDQLWDDYKQTLADRDGEGAKDDTSATQTDAQPPLES